MPLITLKQSGERFSCREGESLLEAAIRNCIRSVASGCQNGGCGICRVKIEFGDWSATGPMSRARLSEDEQKLGLVLACRVSPLSDLVVSVGSEI